jgi:hypothetical protein
MAKLTKPQLKKIWATARELGMDKDLLYSVVQHLTGSDSISSLTIAEANTVIDFLTNQAIPGRATKQQIWKINRLAEELGWDDNPSRLVGFIKKYAGVENIKWLTSNQAWRIIEGLKKMKARQDTLTKTAK